MTSHWKVMFDMVDLVFYMASHHEISKIAGATLSGCPSISVAKRTFFRDKFKCASRLANSMPATITLELLPSPLARECQKPSNNFWC